MLRIKQIFRKDLFLCSLLSFSICSYAKEIKIRTIEDFERAKNVQGLVLNISCPIDMLGTQINLPKEALLKFSKNGKLCNGVLYGNNNNILSGNRIIFDNVHIKGCWRVSKIYGSWFDLTVEDCQIGLQNLLNLQSPSYDNLIVIEDACIHWKPSRDNFSLLKLLSNSTLLLDNTVIETSSNDCPYYRVIDITGADNVRVDGGSLIGDVESHIYDEESSHGWGFGILVEGSQNVSVKNSIASRFTGDGFYVGGKKEVALGDNNYGCHNLHFDNIKSLYNRRQGMSVTASVDSLLVENSEFSYTGSILSAMPSSGIDLEVNYDTQRLKDVTFRNCVLRNNIKGLCILSRKGNGKLVFENVNIYQNNEFDSVKKLKRSSC